MSSGLKAWNSDSATTQPAKHLGTVTSGSVTGATIQTADSGARVQMDSTNGIRGIDSTGAVTWKGGVDGKLYAASLSSLNQDGRISFVLPNSIGFHSGSYAIGLEIGNLGSNPIKIYADGGTLAPASLSLSGYLSTDSVIMARNYGGTEIGRFNSNGLTLAEGDFVAGLAGKGIILTNAAGTVTKRVRLNDAGNGLIFE